MAIVALAAGYTAANVPIRAGGLKINVDDMQKALAFYVDKLGFEIESRAEFPQRVSLKTANSIRLILNKVEKLRKPDPTATQVGVTLQVNDLETAISRMKLLGVPLDEAGPRKEGVGNAIYIYDPFGRRISLMHQTIVKVPEFKEPKIYNFGLLIPDMESARDFYVNKLGFVVRSEKYLPKDLPLGHADNSFGFMLHYREGVKTINPRDGASPFYTIVYETEDIQSVVKAMAEKGVEIVGKRRGQTVLFRDPFGNISELTAKADTGKNKTSL